MTWALVSPVRWTLIVTLPAFSATRYVLPLNWMMPPSPIWVTKASTEPASVWPGVTGNVGDAVAPVTIATPFVSTATANATSSPAPPR